MTPQIDPQLDNPFAEMQDELHRQDAEARALKAWIDARAKLVLSTTAQSVFFASLAFRLKLLPDWTIPTAATDGKKLIYNPDFTLGLKPEEQTAVLVHEILHCALGHMWRRDHRDPEKWNIACDLGINPVVRDAGYKLPAKCLWPADAKLPEHLSAEDYYTRIPDPPQDSGQDPGGCGGVIDPGDGGQAAKSEAKAEWEIATVQAAEAAKQRGNVPGFITRLVEAVLAPSVDWREVLREFVTKHSRNDYSWLPPNRRFVHQGLYLPSLHSEELGDIVLAVDVSGSIGAKELQRFASEIQGILDAYACTLHLLYHDSDVQQVTIWTPSDGPLKLEAIGGGGTSHRPVFDHIEREGMDPTCLVGLTDLYSDFPLSAPDYPVLWAVPKGSGGKEPWGVRLEIDN